MSIFGLAPTYNHDQGVKHTTAHSVAKSNDNGQRNNQPSRSNCPTPSRSAEPYGSPANNSSILWAYRAFAIALQMQYGCCTRKGAPPMSAPTGDGSEGTLPMTTTFIPLCRRECSH